MSFFFGRPSQKSSPAPSASPSERDRLRGRQVASLVRAGGQAINIEQTIFDVVIRLPDSRTLTLRITLPDDFPMQAPLIQTTSRVQHRWLDSQCHVAGHIDLASWSVHADIGRIVSDIINEFQRNPPAMAGRTMSTPPPAYHPPQPSITPAYNQPFYAASQTQQQPPSYTQYPASMLSTPASYKSYSRESTPPPQKPKEQYVHTQTPAIPTSFPELNELPTSQLENLVSDRQALKAYIRNMDSVINFMKLYEELLKGNTELAEKNLTFESTVADLQKDVQGLKTQVQAAQEVLNVKQARQQEILSRVRPDILVERVSQAAEEMDENTEDIGSRFTNGEMDVNQFLSEYIPSRKLYHLRAAKVESFKQQQ
ncbi:hypothetical protein THRCLA_04251 [Thraustotheca clavata]|uniref:VPS37 C-terminal domain-containing protein n=1 Tax=Thraustotheca clavata TaxID=74557 RepID=A0A1V9ZZK3_9STRA|nr:hypothetical protein THRCLA_04251 [Thraustotheca clavata]